MTSLDKLSQVFIDNMEPSEEGEPLVSFDKLPLLLEQLNLPAISPELDFLNVHGNIEFEPFVTTLAPLLDTVEPYDGSREIDDSQDKKRSVFYALSQGTADISHASLKKAASQFGLQTSDEEIDDMLKLISNNGIVDKRMFNNLWKLVGDA